MNTKERRLRVAAWPAFINTGNPYASLLYTEISKLEAQVVEASFGALILRPPKIFHIHFPEAIMNRGWLMSVLRTVVFFLQIHFLKIMGTKLVWTVHNLTPHSVTFPRLSRWFWSFYTRRLDGIICLTEGGHRSLVKLFPRLADIPYTVTPHGHYMGWYRDSITPAAARQILGIPDDAKILLHFGNLRSYKNVPRLLEVFQEIQDPSLHLVIAGNAPGGRDKRKFISEIEELAKDNPRIHLCIRFISDDEVEVFFKACDMVVLPYTNIQNSGAAVLALTFAKPVLVPDIGAMSELQDLCGSDWVRLYVGDISAERISEGLSQGIPSTGHADIMEVLDWRVIAANTLEFYLRLTQKTLNEKGISCQ